MPTYEYKCDACGRAFEKFQSIKADPIKRCPACGKAKVKRLLGTGSGVIFKGSGFYTTDYRSESYKTAAKNDSAGGAAPASASDGGGESKSQKSEPAKGESAKPSAESPKPAAKTESKSPDKR